MASIPSNEVTQADLEQWYRLQEELAAMRKSEMLLRLKIFGHYFPDPKEGTNSADLSDGYVIKGKRTINREIDKGGLLAMTPQLAEAGIPLAELVDWKPSLVLRQYRGLTAEQTHLFDQCLIVKDGAPALEIMKPKKRTSK